MNPIRIKNHIRTDLQRSKDDKSDSFAIAKFRAEKNPRPWIPVTEEAIKIQQMAGLIDLYGKEIIQQSNQIHAYSQVEYVSTVVIKSLQKSIKFIQAEKVRTEKKFMALVKKSFSRELEIIESIPGIGENTATRLIASIAYFGLSPTKKQSGSSLNKRGPISRMGECKMRSFLSDNFHRMLYSNIFSPSLLSFILIHSQWIRRLAP